MTTLGKVLIFLNVLAAVAVAYFAADNWAKRHSLNATGLRYAVTIDGLPTEPQPGQPEALTSAPADDSSVSVRLPSGTGRMVEEVPYRLYKAHFTGADGKQPFGDSLPPLSVAGEVKRVEEVVAKFLGRPADKSARANWDPNPQQVDTGLRWLCGQYDPASGTYSPGLLGLLAESYGERQVIKRLLTLPGVAPGGEAAEKKVSFLKAVAMLDKRFAAINGQPSAATAEADAARLATAQKAVKDAGDAVYVPPGAGGVPAKGALALENAARDELSKAPNDTALAEAYRKAQLVTKEARDRFTAALDELEAALADVGLAASRNDDDRRSRALLLLSHLEPTDAAWQKRMILLFGQPEYVASQSDRILKLGTYPAVLDDERLAANARFLAEYERMKQAAKDRDRFLEQQKELLAEAKLQVAAATDLYAQRRKYQEERAAVAAGLTAQVRALAAEQQTVEGELFALQLKVGRLLRDNFDLEERLIQAERQAVPPAGR